MTDIALDLLKQWCEIPAECLEDHRARKIPFRLCESSGEMGDIMAQELVAEIRAAQAGGQEIRAIIPCGPSCWYEPFTRLVNAEQVSLENLVVFHMDECLAARKVRLFSDTGAWKQTALRVALFGPMTPEYPMTLLQEHVDALLTATRETARHPLGEHPEWDLGI